ncbi:hypothetical protein [Alistipes sp.]|uniref:hypothetical protein n=1 Tax=Alistipes sp. TaxID=1872444 RepID=UPI003AF5ADC9
MKKHLILVSTAVALALQACVKYEKPAEPTFQTVGLTDAIEIAGIAGDHPAISQVAFVARYHMPPGVKGSTAAELAQEHARVMLRASFSDGGTRLLLPENPPQALMSSIAGDIPEGFEISDPAANTVSFTEIACDMDGDRVSAHLYLGRTVGATTYRLQYVYCDRPVTVTGSGVDWWEQSTTYDLKLEKGWNRIVERSDWSADSKIQTVTNRMPDGMEWRYDMWLGER